MVQKTKYLQKSKKMRNTIMLLSSFGLLIFIGCQVRKEQNWHKAIKYYGNGDVEIESEIVDGKRNGRSIEYFEGGHIRQIGAYKENNLHGEVLTFYPNGKLKTKVVFKEGVPDGMAYYFYPSGVISAFRYWQNGKLSGYVSDYWDTIGEVKSALHYDDNGKLVYKRNFDQLGHFIGQE